MAGVGTSVILAFMLTPKSIAQARSMTQTPPSKTVPPGGWSAGRIRWRALWIGSLLIVPSQYWVTHVWTGFTLPSLFINAVFVVFLLNAINLPLRRFGRAPAFRASEQLLIYLMLAVATGTAGHDTLEMLTQVVGYIVMFSSPENEWVELFGHYLPNWLLIDDENVMEGFYRFGSTLFEHGKIYVWLPVMLRWSLFLVVLYFGMMCLNLLLRKQWVDRERLSFPVAQIPLGMISPTQSAFTDRLFWTGFLISAALNLSNGLHRLFPLVPGLTYGKFDIGTLFPDSPWNAIDVAYIEFLPFIVGISFFIPVNLSFSIWFFYWFWKLASVFGRVSGLSHLPGYPGYWVQGMGGMMLLSVMFLVWARSHLTDVFRVVFLGKATTDPDDDTPNRFAFWGFLASFAFLVGYMAVAGMALWVGVLFIGIYYGMSLVTTRLRAQLGPPTHELPFTSSSMLTSFLSPKAFDGRTLTQFAIFRFIGFGQRGTPMPQMMESLYIKERINARQIGMLLSGLVIAIVLGTAVGFVGNVQRSYTYSVGTWVGEGAFPQLAGWLQYRQDAVDWVYVIWFFVGVVVVYGLSWLSRVFIWWPLHPLGYIMGSEWMLRHFWFSIFLAWALRWTLLKFGGMSAHRKAIPFFLGVTVADAVLIAVWSIIGQVFNVWTLGFTY
ncbi:MAG: hypothetical protein O3A46_07415 [Candidatus Poribacteria bacterium]|nr:hypothetical protein [Candidatus Poribacteria bacterium]